MPNNDKTQLLLTFCGSADGITQEKSPDAAPEMSQNAPKSGL